MKIKTQLFVMIVTMLVAGWSSHALADKYTDTIDVFKKSEAVQPFFKNAYGYAVFPTIGKAGIGIGGSYGTGQVYQGGTVTGEASVVKGTIGFQLGAQAFSQMIFFEDKRAYDEFTSGNFEFGAQAEAIAITASAGASAGTEGTSASANETQSETSYHKGMIVFTMGKGGLMYQAALGGQKYDYTPSK